MPNSFNRSRVLAPKRFRPKQKCSVFGNCSYRLQLEVLEDRLVMTGPPTGIVVNPTSGKSGDTLSIAGQNLSDATQVDFNLGATTIVAPQSSITNNAANLLNVVVPSLTPGTYSVIVVTAGGASTPSATSQFTVGAAVKFVGPRGGPTTGGTPITVRGLNFSAVTEVDFTPVAGGNPAASLTAGQFTLVDSATITFASPALAFGTYDITVNTSDGPSPVTQLDQFVVGPTVTGLSATSGVTSLTVQGGDFEGATEVDFVSTVGSTAVMSAQFTSATATSITLPVPTGLQTGAYDVVVKTANGVSTRTSADQFMVSPVAFSFSNQTNLEDTPVYLAVAGQLALDADGHPTTDGTGTLTYVYFNAQGQWSPTAPLAIGHVAPDFNYVPTFPLAFDSQGNAVLNLPHVFMNSFRIVMSVGTDTPAAGQPVGPKLPIVSANGAAAAPNFGNASDPNQQLYVDFIEFTLNQLDQLYIDTTLVDQFGFPITLQTTPKDTNSALTDGVGVQVERDVLFTTSFVNYLDTVGAPAAFQALATSEGSGTLAGQTLPFRILSPKDFVQLNQNAGTGSSSLLNSYFNSSLITLFTTYSASGSSLLLKVPNPNFGASSNSINPDDPQFYQFVGRTTTVTNGANTYTVLQFTDPGDEYDNGTQSNAQFNVFAPFFQSNQSDGTTFPTTAPFPATLPTAPPVFAGGSISASEWPSEMVWANDGVFADNQIQFNAPASNTTSALANLQSNLLANIENQVVSALTRGIANNAIPAGMTATDYWTASTTPYYVPGSTANFYAGFWHQANSLGGISGGVPVSIGNFAYAFPYDDQGNNSSTIVSTNPTSVSITLRAFVPESGGDPTNAVYVRQLYREVLNRSADTAGAAFWTGVLDSHSLNFNQVALAFFRSAEHRGIQVDSFYQTLLGRGADPEGRAYYVGQLFNSGNEEAVQLEMVNSQEFQQAHASAQAFVSALYLDILQRQADQQSQAFWEAQASTPEGRALVAGSIIGSAEDIGNRINAFYESYLGRPADATGSTYWLDLVLSRTDTIDQVAAGILSSPEARGL